jgi:hypothetical protein
MVVIVAKIASHFLFLLFYLTLIFLCLRPCELEPVIGLFKRWLEFSGYL